MEEAALQQLGSLDEKTIREMLRQDPEHPDRFASFFHRYLQAMEDLHGRRQQIKDDQVHQHVDQQVQAAQQRAALNRELKLLVTLPPPEAAEDDGLSPAELLRLPPELVEVRSPERLRAELRVAAGEDRNDPDGDSRKVDTMQARGNVNLREADFLATSDTADFTDGTAVIDLTGSVVVFIDRDRMEADRFRYDRRTGKKNAQGNVKFRFRLPSQEGEAPADPAAETDGEAAGAETTDDATDAAGQADAEQHGGSED